MASVSSTARIHTDSTGAYTEIPILLTPSGPLMPLLDYCVSRSHDRSISWMKKLLQAVALFLDYLEANQHEPEHWRLFRNFSQRLYGGTYDLKSGIDPSYLCWAPRDWKTSNFMVVLLSEFFDWLGQTNTSAKKLNPRYEGSLHDQRIDHLAYIYRRNRAFLGHVWAVNSSAPNARSFLVRPKTSVGSAPKEPPEFPSDRFEELLFKGFQVAGRYDYRGMLISLLLHGAGFRECEPFHLYVSDVQRDQKVEDSALVQIHHPEIGAAPDDWFDEKGRQKLGTRKAYLASKWGLPPRTALLDRRAAGWKNPKVDGDFFMRAWWYEPIYGKLFLHIWERYIEQVAMLDRNHPFAFVNLDREPKGGMYTINTFRAAHEQAVRRINMPYGKSYGTTEHGHRHSYAQRLRRAGIGQKMMQTFLHHKSVESQAIYTEPTTSESLLALAQAYERMRTTSSSYNMPLSSVILD